MNAQNTLIYQKKTIIAGGKIISLEAPIVMGILNVTPDSFYENSRTENDSSLISSAQNMLEEGASILDIGGYSSRPGAKHISEKEEIDRVIPSIKTLKKEFPDCILSVDTFRSNVAEQAVYHGADLINDISGGEMDKEMMKTVAKLKVPYILMHMKGTPQTMTSLANYENILLDIFNYFKQKIRVLNELGIHEIILDPGLGFAKTVEQNFELLKNIHYLTTLAYPILVGVSRKSMIYKTLNTTPDFSLNGTTVLNTVAILQGASILRVHDVKAAKEAIKLTEQIR